jgi:TBC1 domain family protein 5
MMFNILFIWSKENKDVSYRQGMNEILAVLLFANYPFYFSQNNMKHSSNEILNFYKTDKLKYANEIYHYFHNQDELQSDLFFLFDSIMSRGIKGLFDSGNLKKNDIPSFKKQDLFHPQWTDEDETDKVF